MKKWIASGILFAVAAVAQAIEFKTESNNGKNLTLKISEEQISRSTRQAVLCSDVDVRFTKFKLWMTMHNHGSTPTSLTTVSSQCANVDKINFVMSGPWDLQVQMEDGDAASFSVNVP